MKTTTVDLATDPRAERIRNRLAVYVEAFAELEDLPEDFSLYDTKYAKILRYQCPKICTKTLFDLVEKRIAFLRWAKTWNPGDDTGIVVRESDDGQFHFEDGTNRAAWLRMNGRPVTATLEPKFEDLFK